MATVLERRFQSYVRCFARECINLSRVVSFVYFVCSAIAGGTRITITGSNFGPGTSSNGGPISITVRDSTYTCDTVATTVAHTQLQCNLPAMTIAGTYLPLSVRVDGLSTSRQLISYQVPRLTGGTLKLCSGGSAGSTLALTKVDGGEEICFQGANFGSSMPAVTVKYGGTFTNKNGQQADFWRSCQVTYVDATNIHCLTSAGFGTGLRLQVQVGFAISQIGTDSLSYPAPQILPGTIRLQIDDVGSTSVMSPSTAGGPVFFNVSSLTKDPTLLASDFIAVRFSTSQTDSPPGPFDCLNPSTPIDFDGNVRALQCRTVSGVGMDYQFTIHVLNQDSVPLLGTDKYVSCVSFCCLRGGGVSEI
jgi:hypothetical protein